MKKKPLTPTEFKAAINKIIDDVAKDYVKNEQPKNPPHSKEEAVTLVADLMAEHRKFDREQLSFPA